MNSIKNKLYASLKGKPLSQELQQQHQRRSEKIIFLRKFSCAVIILMGVTLIAWPQIEKFLNSIESQGDNSFKHLAVQNRIQQPRMHSYDKDRRPFNIDAQSAEQVSSEKIGLEQPFSKHILHNGIEIEINGDQGIFHQNTKFLNYEKNVKLKTSSGYEFTTDSASIDTNGKSIEGSKPIVGKGPSSEIVAQGFKIENEGNKIHFIGKSTLILNASESPDNKKVGLSHEK
ncbi:MAG: LPS export ABC transporter periplasmic protein LptC [Candidatus Paracaedimonas acanthamoebae]|uniref:LPS export ABC transporter periplasmic protein LptC n=1 Tax=Candidatus Paracaedimonas acanthamoebae TaxID=244581 RepID=A0A8J7PZD5_9PROT|nr:LPS export ABC transporter periplasmic protein LptC [Candidatus Paracaedimonas acanthamoebae]